MKHWWKKISNREKAMIIALALILLCSVYITQRLTVIKEDMRQINSQLSKVTSKKSKTRPLKINATNLSAIQKEIAYYTEQNQRIEAELEDFNRRLLDLSMSDSVAQAQSAITQLAAINRLRMLHVKQSKSDMSTLTGQAAPSKDMNRIRPFMEIRVQGNFFNTHKFIQSLQSLPFLVSIMHMKIHVVHDVNTNGNRLLDTQLTLSF